MTFELSLFWKGFFFRENKLQESRGCALFGSAGLAWIVLKLQKRRSIFNGVCATTVFLKRQDLKICLKRVTV